MRVFEDSGKRLRHEATDDFSEKENALFAVLKESKHCTSAYDDGDGYLVEFDDSCSFTSAYVWHKGKASDGGLLTLVSEPSKGFDFRLDFMPDDVNVKEGDSDFSIVSDSTRVEVDFK